MRIPIGDSNVFMYSYALGLVAGQCVYVHQGEGPQSKKVCCKRAKVTRTRVRDEARRGQEALPSTRLPRLGRCFLFGLLFLSMIKSEKRRKQHSSVFCCVPSPLQGLSQRLLTACFSRMIAASLSLRAVREVPLSFLPLLAAAAFFCALARSVSLWFPPAGFQGASNGSQM